MNSPATYNNPFEFFSDWYATIEKEARDNYNAVALSTSGQNGNVSSRMVLLKNYDDRGFVFFSNYESRKGKQLDENPNASLLFYWPEYGRQVRIEGIVEKISASESDEYFDSRIHGHKINAIASSQSTQIPDRQYLIKRYDELIKEHGNKAPARPDYWGGYRFIPELFEFWQEGENRFHDRIEYRLQGNRWVMRILAP
ncbi:MAG: pyridoxamine 5'-phosphate oxidase [Bacteroidales bacterium]|nr:pyridoxamine 5'-phosphate oxidase [Bacteroidales bacterium]